MNDEVIGPNYTGSTTPICKGDRVSLDLRSGLVELVALPRSEDAIAYSCEESGGVLVLFDDGILELIPFGFYHKISKET